MASCVQCCKRCQRNLHCPFCGVNPLCLTCVCTNCWCDCKVPEPTLFGCKCGRRMNMDARKKALMEKKEKANG